jgi:hypothetical protein
MTYSINATIPTSGTCSQQTPYQEEIRVSAVNKVAFFTFASLATFFAVASSVPLAPVTIPLTVSLFTAAVLTSALTSARRIPCYVQSSYTPVPILPPRVSYYRPSFHYIPFSVPTVQHRNFCTGPRRDVVGERGSFHRSTFHTSGFPIHTTTQHRMSFTFPKMSNSGRRDVVGGRSSF